MFSGNLDREIIDFMNNEGELLNFFEKDTVEDAHITASEDTPLINISVTPNLSELEALIDKEYDEYVVWRNSNSLFTKGTSSAGIHLQFITGYIFNVLLFMALLIILKLVLVFLNHL